MISVRGRTTKRFPEGAVVIDVTSKSLDERFRMFSPFCPAVPEGIAVPDGFLGPEEGAATTLTVEGAWQGLKVFENEGVKMDALITVPTKAGGGMKRNASKARGAILGHGVHAVDYLRSRKELYIPMYERQMDALDHLVGELVEHVRAGRKVFLLDYNTNVDVEDTSKPLSHASLIAKRVRERA
jgi:hypothetical protein